MRAGMYRTLKTNKKRAPLDAECVAFCERWAAVWRGLACYARAHDYPVIAERFTDAADDIFEAMEAQL